MERTRKLRRNPLVGALAVLVAVSALGIQPAPAQVVDYNVNVTGTGADGYDVGQLGRQENEPSCKANPLNELNIMCAYNFYGYADLPDLQGDSWIAFSETRDGHNFIRRVLTGTRQNSWNGQDFAADPTMLVSEGFAAVTNISGIRGGNSIMQIQRMMEVNTETGFRHISEAGQIEVASISGSNFIDKPDARIIPHPDGGTAPVTMTLEDGSTITRILPRIRILVTFAVFNGSNQNIRTYSTYSDEFGAPGSWSNTRQITQTSGLDQGLSVANIDDKVMYVVRRFAVGSEPDSILGAISRDGGDRIGKVFEITADTGLCPFDQVTLPDPLITQNAVSFRTNNFPWVAATANEFVLVYSERPRLLDGSCSTVGSRVMVRTSQNGTSWSSPVEVSPVAGHAFQFMQSIDCTDEFCQALWYDTRNESIAFDAALTGVDKKHWEANPFVEDFNVNDRNLGLLRFRRTADVYTNRINIVNGQPVPNAQPERVSRYIVDNEGYEREFNLMNVRAFGGNTVPFDGDYIAITKLGSGNFFAAWTDWRNARGRLVDSNFSQPSPYVVSTDSVVADAGGDPGEDLKPSPNEPGLPEAATEIVAAAPVTEDRFLSAYMPRAEGLGDENPFPPVCSPVVNESLNTPFNTQTKNSEIFGAVIEDRVRLVSPTVSKNYCINRDPSTGNCLPGAQIQRTFVLGVNNDDESDREFTLVIASQPGKPVQIGQQGDDQILVNARASWRQLPFGPVFDQSGPPPVVVETLTVPGQSFDYVTLFVVSQSTDAPVTVLAYDDSDTLVSEITVNGISESGDLVDPGVGADVRIEEVHNPALIQPDWSSLSVEALNPAYRNPSYRNPAYRNPAYRNPAYRNEAFQDTSLIEPDTDSSESDPDSAVVYDYELREPTELLNPALRNPAFRNPALRNEAFVDVTFGVEGQTNTISAYNADFAFAGEELNELDTQLIAWNDNEVDSLRNCGYSQISEDTVVAAVNNPSFRNLAIADINNNLEGAIHFVTGVQDVTNVTIRIFGEFSELEGLVDVPDGCDPEAEECSVLQQGLGWVIAAQAGNTADCNDPGNVAACQIIKDKTLIIKDVIPPVFEPPLEDGTTYTSQATFSDPDAAAEVDLVSTIPLSAFDNGTEVEVTCFVNGVETQTAMPTLVPLGDSGAQCDTEPDGQGNVGTWTGFVRVEDNEAPTISIPGGDGAQLLVAPDDADGAIVTYLGDGNFNGGTITVSDNIFKDGYPYPSMSCEPDSGTLFPVGPTTVTCTATDAGPCDPAIGASCIVDADFPDGHNVTMASFTVTVRDLEAPVFDDVGTVEEGFLPDVGPIEATAVQTPVDLPAPNLTDDIDDSPTAVQNVDPPEFPLGTTVVTWTASDFSGNESTAQQRVIIQDTTAPVVTVSFPGGTTQSTDSLSGKSVAFDVDIEDIFPDASSIACTIDGGTPVVSGDLFPVGDTTVTCTGADTSGNSGSGSATVTIEFRYSESGILGKTSGKTGSSFPLTWQWTDSSGTPQTVSDQALSIEPGTCPASGDGAIDPGSSGLRQDTDGTYLYNLQAVDPMTLENLPAERPYSPYCFTVALPNGQFKDLDLSIRP